MTGKLSVRGAIASLVILVTGGLVVGLLAGASPKPKFTKNGELVRPEGYREWVYVGTPLTPNDLNPPRSRLPRVPQRLHTPDGLCTLQENRDIPGWDDSRQGAGHRRR